MRKILFSRPMMFASGMLVAVLMAQAAAPTPTQPEAPQVGRFQAQFLPSGRGGLFPRLLIADTATGRYSLSLVGFRGRSQDVFFARGDTPVVPGRYLFKGDMRAGGALGAGVVQYRLFAMDTVTGNWSYEPIPADSGDWRDLVSPAD